MRCKKCRFVNPDGATECESCGVVFSHIRESVTRNESIQCKWINNGVSCSHRWVISGYCREHWDAINQRPPVVKGNALPPIAKSYAPQFAGWTYNADLRRLVRVGSIEVEHGPEVAISEWMEGESLADLRKRVRSELDKLVPEEVGQA